MTRQEKLHVQFGEQTTETLGQAYFNCQQLMLKVQEEMAAIEVVVTGRFAPGTTESEILTSWGTFRRTVKNSWQIVTGKVAELRDLLGPRFPLYIKTVKTCEVAEDQVERLKEILGDTFGSLIRESTTYAIAPKLRTDATKDAELASSLDGRVEVKQKVGFEFVPVPGKEVATP